MEDIFSTLWTEPSVWVGGMATFLIIFSMFMVAVDGRWWFAFIAVSGAIGGMVLWTPIFCLSFLLFVFWCTFVWFTKEFGNADFIRKFARSDRMSPEDFLLKNIKAMDHPIRAEIGRNPLASHRVLLALSFDPCYRVRLVVARNARTPHAVVRILGWDRIKSVSEAARRNPNFPPPTWPTWLGPHHS